MWLHCSVPAVNRGDEPLLSITSGQHRGNRATSTDANSYLWVNMLLRLSDLLQGLLSLWLAGRSYPTHGVGLGQPVNRERCCGAPTSVGQPLASARVLWQPGDLGSWRGAARCPCPSVAWKRISRQGLSPDVSVSDEGCRRETTKKLLRFTLC